MSHGLERLLAIGELNRHQPGVRLGALIPPTKGRLRDLGGKDSFVKRVRDLQLVAVPSRPSQVSRPDGVLDLRARGRSGVYEAAQQADQQSDKNDSAQSADNSGLPSESDFHDRLSPEYRPS